MISEARFIGVLSSRSPIAFQLLIPCRDLLENLRRRSIFFVHRLFVH